jgi:hypothetical protein
MTTAVPVWVTIFLLNHGQVKHITPIFISSTKKGDFTKCTNNCNTALYPHANKILLCIIKKRRTKNMKQQWKMEDYGKDVGHGGNYLV